MLPLNDYVWLKDYELNKLPAVVAGAEKHRLLAEAGLIRRHEFRAPHLWLSCRICRSLWRLGNVLVAAGRRLEQRYAPAGMSPARG